jgi:2-polyprenyl-6-methoxyphenol hydroxylase-like FAD-dependent oxidoreductase
MERSDVVVVGGGVVGLAAAAALDALGARVTVLEAHDGPNPAFRGELVHPRGARSLAKLGLVDPLLDAGAARVRGFAVFDAPAPQRVEPVLLPYARRFGDGIALDHVQLVEVMRREVGKRARVRVLRSARVREAVTVQGRVVGVRVEGGAEHRAALVIAADGRHSRTRKLLGIETQTELISHSVAIALDRDVLDVPSHGHVFVDTPGPTLAYPCGGGHVRMVIDVPLGAAKGQERLRAYLREHCLPRLPESLGASMAEAMDRSPLGGAANHALYTSACAVRGAALVGDAGGCSHPITAAGMTNGMHDVATLAECVERRGLTDAALTLYQRRRYRYIRGREAFTRALYDVLLGATPGTRGLRDGMFAYWRGAERARDASMAVLSGDDERVTTFVTEYLRVVATSSALRARAAFGAGRPAAAWSGVRAVVGAAGDAMRVAVEKAGSALALERSAPVADAPSALGGGANARPGEGRAQDLDDGALHPRVPVDRRDAVEQA